MYLYSACSKPDCFLYSVKNNSMFWNPPKKNSYDIWHFIFNSIMYKNINYTRCIVWLFLYTLPINQLRVSICIFLNEINTFIQLKWQ